MVLRGLLDSKAEVLVCMGKWLLMTVDVRYPELEALLARAAITNRGAILDSKL